VDTDAYTAPVNLPFIATAPDGVYTLPKGTPLAQIVPFRRADVALRHVIRAETPQESQTRDQIHRSTLAEDGWYRRKARAGR
jgi:hypothetical protein